MTLWLRVLRDHVTNKLKPPLPRLPRCLWSPKLAGVWLTLRGSYHGLARPNDKVKLLYLHYHSAYDHKTYQEGELLWATSTHKVMWLYNYVVLRVQVTKGKHIFTTKMPLATKPGRMMTYLERLLPKKSHDHIVTYSCKATCTCPLLRPMIVLCTRPMTTKIGKMVIYYEKIPPIKSQICWTRSYHVRSHDNVKTLYFHYNNVYGQQNLVG